MAWLVTPSRLAVMLVVPVLVVLDMVATPLASIVATLVFDDTHVATLVMSNELPPLSFPVAVNAWVMPAPGWRVPVGLRVIVAKVGGTTVTVAVEVMLELWIAVAVTVIFPTVTELTRPEAEILAATGSPVVSGAIDQDTAALPVLPSLNVPLALI